MRVCEGCRGNGANWDCMGMNDPEECECENCTGNTGCPECGENSALTDSTEGTA